MQPPKNDHPYLYLPISLAKNIAYGLGRFWSLCTKSLAQLIERINSVSRSNIQTPAPNPANGDLPKAAVSPPSPLKFPSPGEGQDQSAKQSVAINFSNHPPVKHAEDISPARQEPEEDLSLEEEQELPFETEPELPYEEEQEIPLEAEHELSNEEIEMLEKEYLLSLLPEVPRTLLEIDSHEDNSVSPPHPAASPIQLEPEPLIDSAEEAAPEIDANPAKSPASDFGLPKPRFRRRNRRRNRKSNNPTRKMHAPQAKPAQDNHDQNPIIIEAGGGGNCQPLSFLKGLELQYPQLLKHEVNGRIVDYTADEIRKMGVDFIRLEIDSLGPHAETMIGYLDTDRLEYNEIFLTRIKEDLARKRAILEKKKLNPLIHAKYEEIYRKQYEVAKAEIAKKHFIQNDFDFLNRLEKPGFYCSTLHLFVYSIKFDIPIHIYEQYGVPGHDIQFFNPNKEKEPICLYRVGNIHYQLILFPKIARP